MAVKKKTARATPDVKDVLKALEKHASKKTLAEYAPRYGIVAKKAFGVPMAKIQLVAKSCGRDHALAEALWKSGWSEARLLASMVDEIAHVTPAQMERWRADFDNWGVVDTVIFKLFDQSPHALTLAAKWVKLRDEWDRRAGFVMIACVALHRKDVADAEMLRCLKLIEDGAEDERNFVKKGVSWALRAIGGKKSPVLRKAARECAARLAASENAAARWVGKDALRAFR